MNWSIKRWGLLLKRKKERVKIFKNAQDLTCILLGIQNKDIYGDGHSERLIAQVLSERREVEDKRVYIITKVGRAPNPHGPQNYTYENLVAR